jgi:hypothetical protein
VAYTHTILLWVAGFTMVTGVLGAAAMNDFRRILSFHIVSQIGYMILGLALFTPLAIVGAVFYLVHHIIVKANLFLVAGVAQRIAGSTDLSAIGGLYKTAPLLGVLFLIPAFSLAGFPPLSGFWAKYVLVKAALDAEAYVDRRRGVGRWSADDLLHDENLGQRVLETASGRHRAEAHLACAQGPRVAFGADRGTGRADLHHRPSSPNPSWPSRSARPNSFLTPRPMSSRYGGDAGNRVGPGATGGK